MQSHFSGIPEEFNPIIHNHSEMDISDLQHYSDANIDGSESAFEDWDKNVSDDFNSDYNSLNNKPDLTGFVTKNMNSLNLTLLYHQTVIYSDILYERNTSIDQ